MRRFCYLSFALLSVIGFGCNNKVKPEAYLKWVQDEANGLRVIKSSGDFNFDVQFKPSQFISIERGESADVPEESSTTKHVTLKVSLLNGDDLVQYHAANNTDVQKSLYYYSFLFEKDIYLEANGQKFPCALYHFEKFVDSKNQRTFHLAFDVPEDKPSEEFTLIVDSNHMSSLPIRFKIRNNNIPQVAGL